MNLHQLLLLVASIFFVESTQKHQQLERSGFPVRSQSTRRRRTESYSDGTAMTKTVRSSCDAEVVILNGYKSDDEMTVEFPKHLFRLNYGEFTSASFHISTGELFVVRVRNVSSVGDVGDALPPSNSCSVYIVVSNTPGGQIDVEKTIWNSDEKIEDSRFSLLTYGLRYVEMDVLAFEPRKVGTDQYSLHLVAKHDDFPYEASLDAGTYDVKVTPSGLVQNIDDFKNTESYTRSVYVTFEGRKRYFGAVIGNVTGDGVYPLQYKVYPRPVHPCHPKPTPLTEVLVMNAYPTTGQVQVTLEQYAFATVKYLHGTRGNVYLKKGDAYQIGLDDDNGITYYVQENVPYVDGTCVIIIDSGEEEQVEHVMHCVYPYAQQAKNRTSIFTYSGLRQCSMKTDVLLLGNASEAVCDERCNRFYLIAHELSYGDGTEARIDFGQYTLKVVSANSVRNSVEFQTAFSIAPELSDRIATKIYITVLTGVCGNDTYPPVVFNFSSDQQYTETQKLYKYSKCDIDLLSSSSSPPVSPTVTLDDNDSSAPVSPTVALDDDDFRTPVSPTVVFDDNDSRTPVSPTVALDEDDFHTPVSPTAVFDENDSRTPVSPTVAVDENDSRTANSEASPVTSTIFKVFIHVLALSVVSLLA